MINLTQRRRYLRINTNTVAKIVCNNSASFGMIKNISAGGVKLDMELNKFKTGDIIEVFFRYKNVFYNTYGIVVRDVANPCPFGIKFVFKDRQNKDHINTQILEDYVSFNNSSLSSG